ncbi:hypothetical protein GCM10009593_01570 [Microlunatus antarcticus]
MVRQQRFATGRRFIGVVVLAVTAGVLGTVPASATPVSVPAPVERLAEAAGHDLVAQKHDRAGERHALAIPGEDDEAWLDVDPGCATGTGKAKVAGYVYTPTKVKLDYVLTGTGLRKTGTVKTKADRPVSFSLPSVRTGSYHLTVALHGRTDLVADATFDVLPCVTVKASCRAVTFTNPAGNPAAYGLYRGHKKNQDFELDLAPGASLTVRADHSKIDYDLTSDDSGLGNGTIKVKQSCKHGAAQPDSHALQTTGYVGCAQSAAKADVQLGWSAQPSLKKLRFEVLDAQQAVVAKGTPKGGREKDLSLAAGSYTYRSYANGLAKPFEDVAFVVLGCVEITPRCEAIELRNPNPIGVVVELETAGDGDPDEDYVDPVTVGAGQTVTVPWQSTGAYAAAYLDDPTSLSQSYFLSLASPAPWDEDSPEIVVPQNC